MSGKDLLLLGSSFGVAQYKIERSLRFNSADTAYLSRTPSSSSNRKTFTMSLWTKIAYIGANQKILFTSTDNASDTSWIFFNTVSGRGTEACLSYEEQAPTQTVTTAAVFRDPSAWYHIVVAVDSTQATSSDRVKIYVNGVQQTLTGTYPSLNNDSQFNASGFLHSIGTYWTGTLGPYDGYITEFNWIDGQQLTPSSFGETNIDTGVWQPKQYTGTYGTNGFYLQMVNSSVVGQLYKSSTLYTTKADILANATAISGGTSISSEYLYYVPNGTEALGGYVFSSNGSLSSATRYFYRSGGSWVQTAGSYGTTEFTLMIFGSDSSIYRLSPSRDFYLLSSSTGQAPATGAVPTLQPSILIDDASGNNNDFGAFNFSFTAGADNDSLVDTPTPYGTDTGAGGEVRGNYCTWNPLWKDSSISLSNGNLQPLCTSGTTSNGLATGTIAISSGKWYWESTVLASSSMWAAGIVKTTVATPNYSSLTADSSYAWNDTGTKYNGQTGTSYGASYTTNDVIGIAVDLDAGTVVFYKNGSSQGTAFTGVSGTFVPMVLCNNAVSLATNFGQRPFAYTAPSGFKALNTQNLSTPTVVQGDDYFNTVLYTGNGSTQSITGVGFQPDFVWLKARTSGGSSFTNNTVVDVVRGAGTNGYRNLYTNLSDGELNPSVSQVSVSALNSDGFTLGQNVNTNQNTMTAVAWNWKANGAGVTNTAGDITSTVSANTTAGFSVVTWTASGTYPNTKIGHGIGTAPAFIITKVRTSTASWRIWHKNMNATNNEYYYLGFDTSGAGNFGSNYWVAPTSTTFGVQSSGYDNNSGNMVAYCFAPITGFSAFGSYTGNGSTDGPFVYTGFRPAYILLKNSSSNGYNWDVIDNKRNTYNVVNNHLFPDTSGAEQTLSTNQIDFVSNGFKNRTGNFLNVNGQTYIYAAFAENPFKYALAR